ncbi:MAG TPA: 5'-nucleotidase C-terminal domain-containing protein [Chitinophagaceae bacterium]|nr:5'-nucleotidase C-terminal domain-containing protein [Chitinophagaceae bacterium]
MRKNPAVLFLVSLFLFGVFSCHTPYQSQSLQYKTYRINESQQKDSLMLGLLKLYSENVNNTMNDVVGVAEISLDKKTPECTLGNFMVDAFFTMAEEKYKTKVDAAFLNFGGMRLTQLPAGNVTNGKIFELMPFDNLLILQKLKGDILQKFLDLTASKGGWPVAGITMQIKDKKAVNVMIGGKPLDFNATYTTVNSDFVANGGDNADMLRSVPQITNGYLMRDAIFDYIKKLKSQGKNISAKIENRVTNAE